MGYSVGDKFVIEIKEIDEYKCHKDYKVLENWYVSTDELDKLERLDSDYVNEHYGELQDEAYDKGLEDAWKLARKIFTFNDNKIEQIFCCVNKRSVIDDLTPQEALAKFEVYEKANEIKVGDVVVAVSIESVVTKVGEDFVHTIDKNGSSGKYAKFVCKKTGKHIDIQSVLEQIGGAK